MSVILSAIGRLVDLPAGLAQCQCYERSSWASQSLTFTGKLGTMSDWLIVALYSWTIIDGQKSSTNFACFSTSVFYEISQSSDHA